MNAQGLEVVKMDELNSWGQPSKATDAMHNEDSVDGVEWMQTSIKGG